MKFEVSETIQASNVQEILDCMNTQFKKVAEKVDRNNDSLMVTSIQASFGSINRSDKTNVTVKQARNGLMLIAEVNYQPSVAFWIILILSLFTWVFWLIPIVFYLVQKNTVKESISEVFKRVKDEFEQTGSTKVAPADKLDELQKYAALKEKGILTDEEFTRKKKELLGF